MAAGDGATSRSVEAFQFGDIIKKGNHPGEAYVRRDRRKAFYRREKDSLEGLMRKQRYRARS